jgi:hypothetical protein
MGAGSSAWAHKASDAYLEFIESAPVSGILPVDKAAEKQSAIKFSIALRDLDAALDSLDTNNDRSLVWGEIRQNLPIIQSWVADGMRIDCNRRSLDLVWLFESLEERSDGVYARLATSFSCPNASAISVDYQLMKTLDSTHRLLIGGTLQGQPLASVLSPQIKHSLIIREGSNNDAESTAQSGLSAFAQFFPVGVHHIVTGYDHLAFLLSLLLPIVLLRHYKAAHDSRPTRPGLVALLRTVTAFTLGHSITLVLATFGWIGSPAWVEPAIAVSIGISAWLNLYPVRWVRSDAIALGFGLIHGLGFSSAIREANVSASLLPWALAGFNLGVEAGQLVGIILWCGLQLVLARSQWYERVVVRGGSWALLLLAGFWTLQRTVVG